MIPKKPENSFWSDEQWRAIHEKGKNILVNAGAGSGKTAVLTERIVRILKDGVSLDRLIVLTFTRAAAGEMKERLRKKLMQEIDAWHDLGEALDYLDQPQSRPLTVRASLVRRYHTASGLTGRLRSVTVCLFLKRKKSLKVCKAV